MPFRIDAKSFFLTYPQANNIQGKEQLLEFLTNRRTLPLYCCVAKELHADGNTHYHAIISYTRRFNLRDEKFYDYEGHHPNIQATRSFDAVKEYIEKDQDYITYGTPPTTKRDQKSLHQICEELTREHWEEYCALHHIGWSYCQSIWKRRHPDPTFTIQNPDESLHQHMVNGLREFAYGNWERSLVLIGPTGCGKTTWAIINAPKPALIISHLDRLKDFDQEVHKSIIFDDMTFCHMPTQAQIHLVDWHVPRDIHCRYTVATIPANTPKIFTCNTRPFEEDPSINRRIHVYKINIFT